MTGELHLREADLGPLKSIRRIGIDLIARKETGEEILEMIDDTISHLGDIIGKETPRRDPGSTTEGPHQEERTMRGPRIEWVDKLLRKEEQ